MECNGWQRGRAARRDARNLIRDRAAPPARPKGRRSTSAEGVPARSDTSWSSRRRLWLNDGSCIGLWPTHRDPAGSYRLMRDRTAGGRALRMLTIVDEHSRECLSCDVARKLTSDDTLERLSHRFERRDVSEHIRSDSRV